MKEKKHIDQLFKEGFKNFEATPSPHVWNGIQSKLSQKEDDKKVIPIWIKWGSVAALLALLFTLGNTFFNTSENNITPVITEENTDRNNQKTEENKPIFKENKIVQVEIASEDKNEIIDVEANISKKKKPIKKSNKQNTISDSSETVVAYQDNKKNSSDKNNNINEAVTNNESLIKKETNLPIISEEAVVVEENKNSTKIVPADDTSEIIDTETANAKKDESKKRSIFDAINENEEETVIAYNNKPDNNWDINPNIAPVYYGSLGNGSSIDPTFSDNPKNGDLNLSYGVLISYNLNNRLSVRSGISNVNLSYSTTGLELGIGPVSAATQSIDYDKSANVIIPVDKGTLMASNNDSDNDDFGDITPKSTSGEVSIIQKISYFEMPLELKYALVNNKIGVNIIGGFSTLFLSNNEVSVEAGDFNETLGNANNLSSLSFTTNIGLGLNYSFSQKLMFNIEPMFKYQLNPYTDSSVDYKPYYIGVYSGLSFKF